MAINYSYCGQWEQRADFGGLGRHRATSISIGTKGYMGLGHVNGAGTETYFSDWWEYDPATNAWTQKADFIGYSGNGELGAHGMGLETVGFVGIGEKDDYGWYKFDPALNTWMPAASAPSGGTFQDTGDFIIGHKGYFMKVWTTELYEYDADLDSWSLIPTPLPFSTYFSCSGFSIGGKGYYKISNSALSVNQMWEFDPATASWMQKTPFPGYSRLSSVSFVQYGKGYLICGYGTGSYSDINSEVWSYDPVNDVWDSLSPFPGSSRRYSSGFSIGDRCFMGSGTNGTNFNDFWEFNAKASVEEIELGSFRVYPNPATDQLKVCSDQYKDFIIHLYNSVGVKVGTLQSGLSQATFDVINLSPGMYWLKMEVDGFYTASKSVILQ